MPRPSAAALALAREFAVRRPDPLPELTDEQAEEWRAIAAALPGDWFSRDNLPLLAAYCRHIVAMRHVAQLITAEEAKVKLDLARFDRLLGMQDRESRAMSALATRMRISQQSTYNMKKVKKPVLESEPWAKAA